MLLLFHHILWNRRALGYRLGELGGLARAHYHALTNASYPSYNADLSLCGKAIRYDESVELLCMYLLSR